jgi:hypothetical protein
MRIAFAERHRALVSFGSQGSIAVSRMKELFQINRGVMVAATCTLFLAACGGEASAPESTSTPQRPSVAVTIIVPSTPAGKEQSTVPLSDAGGASPVIGGIDGISGKAVTDGRILVIGWAVDMQFGAPVTRVDVVLDGKTSIQAELGDSRPDVSKSLNRKDVALSGWVATLDLANVAPGDHTLSVLVYDTKQQAHILPFTFSLKVD